MSNSSLISYTKLSPNHSGQRTHSVDRITPHCVVGQLSCETICDCFPAGRGASCNYGIGKDGRIALCVDEDNRSWCSSSNANDLKSWLAIIRAVPSNFQAENASLNNWTALCRMDS